jgi:hypothetical protein
MTYAPTLGLSVAKIASLLGWADRSYYFAAVGSKHIEHVTTAIQKTSVSKLSLK